jgi:ABC-type transport system involved in Fe-S cluster assembly fused permease/ATPase subunit
MSTPGGAALRRLSAGRTTLIIAHRLPTAVDAFEYERSVLPTGYKFLQPRDL